MLAAALDMLSSFHLQQFLFVSRVDQETDLLRTDRATDRPTLGSKRLRSVGPMDRWNDRKSSRFPFFFFMHCNRVLSVGGNVVVFVLSFGLLFPPECPPVDLSPLSSLAPPATFSALIQRSFIASPISERTLLLPMAGRTNGQMEGPRRTPSDRGRRRE